MMAAMAPPTTVVYHQGPEKPNNYMIISALSTLICCPCLGAVAWVFSCDSDDAYNKGP